MREGASKERWTPRDLDVGFCGKYETQYTGGQVPQRHWRVKSGSSWFVGSWRTPSRYRAAKEKDFFRAL